MQTFLPYDDYTCSARCLDNKRLGKQRVEAFQILTILQHPERQYRWRHHPAVLMWEGHEDALSMYLRACIIEWEMRGFKNTIVIPEFIWHMPPPWAFDLNFHLSHRSNLVRKFPEHYKNYFPYIDDCIPYIWPKRWCKKCQTSVSSCSHTNVV